MFARPQEKKEIMVATGIELKQLTNWFLNNRKRFWKPLVDAMHAEPMMKPRMVSAYTSIRRGWELALARGAAYNDACRRYPTPHSWPYHHSCVPVVRLCVRA